MECGTQAAHFNDSHTHAEVLEAFDRAIVQQSISAAIMKYQSAIANAALNQP